MNTHQATFRVPARADAFEAALEGLTRVNVGLMERMPVPQLYAAGIRYKDEPRDVWRHALDVAGEKWGDCEDLAAYRAAELRVSGEDPGAHVTVYQSAPNRYHAIVARGDGSLEDPSRVLGMGVGRSQVGRGPSMDKIGPNMRRHPLDSPGPCNVLGDDPTPEGAIEFAVFKEPGGWGRREGWRGYLKLPLGGLVPGQALMTLGPTKPTPEAAKAATIHSAASALLKDPQIQAALSQVPGGQAIAEAITNPAVESALKSAGHGLESAGHTAVNALKNLKFW